MKKITTETAYLFWERVDIRNHTECWEWIGLLNTHGYGQARFDGKNMNASRAAWMIFHGEVPGGLVVCHKCDNRKCCNPYHMFVGTQGDNVRDCNQKGRGRSHFVCGSAHPRVNAKLDLDKVAKAKRLYEAGVTQVEIGRMFGVDSSVISRAVRGKSWVHVE